MNAPAACWNISIFRRVSSASGFAPSAPSNAERTSCWFLRKAVIDASRYCGTIDCILSPYMPIRWRRKLRSEEHTSELQSLMRISYAVFCLKKKTQLKHHTHTRTIDKTTTTRQLQTDITK